MDLTLRHVEYLRALGEHGSFTKAAAALHVAQPAVSQTIRMLEVGLGIELYDRTARRLTEAGEILSARGARANSELAAALDEIRSLAGLTEGRLRIGAIHWVEPFDLASALAEFHRRHPRIDLSLHEDDAVVMLDRLQAGDLDLVIHNAGPATLRAGTGRRVLAGERVVVAVGQEDPWSARKRVRMEDLAERRTITFRKGAAFRTLVDESFAEQGLRLQVALESSDLLGVRGLAAAGLGAAIVPRSVAEAPGPPVVILELMPAIDREVVLVWRTDHTPPPTVLALLEILRR